MADYEKNESVDRCEEAGAEDTVPVTESGSPGDSIVKSLEEEFSEAARSVEDKVEESSFVQELEKLALVSDPCVEESSEAAETTSVETQVEASNERETDDDLHENPKAIHSQPFVAVSAGSKASWVNCCGLLDFLKPSNQ